MRSVLIGTAILLTLAQCATGQQTVFNVPSADVLDRGKVYVELDGTYMHEMSSGTLTPRVVVGLGHAVEVGLNANGFNVPGQQAFTPTPTVKWKIYGPHATGWSLLVGDDLFIPAQHRTYAAGNYLWTEAAHTWRSGTRFTFGVYGATANVFAATRSIGGQFAFEQPLGKRLTFATDWYTGDNSVGYVTPGIVLKLSRSFTWFGTYQLGNHRLSGGNHQFLSEVGWSF